MYVYTVCVVFVEYLYMIFFLNMGHKMYFSDHWKANL